MKFEITKEWNNYFQFFENNYTDVYFKEEYVKLYNSSQDDAVCYICNEGDNYMIFPFLRRLFNFKGITYFDFETPYGYGGPIANTNDEVFIKEALKLFYNYCVSNKYVCGFVRFHPLLDNSRNFSIGRVLLDRETVAVDLVPEEEQIWMQQIKSKNRSSIKKAANNGLQFIEDSDYRYLDNFIELYNKTMSKLSADDFFIFDKTYYTNFVQDIKDSFLGVVLYNEKVIAGAMFFHSEDFGHYHLSGSDIDHLYLNPNNFMLWGAAKALKARGVKRFHLGGGSNSDPANSLLEFKSRFSPSRYTFNIGKTIFDNEIYSELCLQWEADNSNTEKKIQLKNHLLKYKY